MVVLVSRLRINISFPHRRSSDAARCRRGKLAAVMKTMGHRDVKTAMHYQHPELEVVRAALDYGTASETAEMRA